MSDATGEIELKSATGQASGFQQWADVFYGVLVAPQQTMAVLADDSQYKSNGGALVMAGVTVFSSSLIALISSTGGDLSGNSQICVALCLVIGIQAWALSSILLYAIARIFKSPNRSLGSAFVVTGWAFLPFYFVSPAKCLLNIPLVGILTMCAIGAWVLSLDYAAYKSILGLSHRKMLALAVVVPALYKLSVLFGVIFVAALIF